MNIKYKIYKKTWRSFTKKDIQYPLHTNSIVLEEGWRLKMNLLKWSSCLWAEACQKPRMNLVCVYLNPTKKKICRNWEHFCLNLTRSNQDQDIQQFRWHCCRWDCAMCAHKSLCQMYKEVRVKNPCNAAHFCEIPKEIPKLSQPGISKFLLPCQKQCSNICCFSQYDLTACFFQDPLAFIPAF